MIETNLTTWRCYRVNSVGIQNSEISIKTVFGPTEVNFQPIPACGGSISVAETVSDSYQGSRTLRNRQKPSESIKSSQRPRANTSLSYHAEDSVDENTLAEDPRGLNND